MLLSVIVPVYNARKYLSYCVESLLKLSIDNYELIFVNDGSTDGSDVLLNEYKDANSFIKVLHKENKGVVAARNSGIKIAQGKYIAFVDADDWVDSDIYTSFIKLMEANKDIDICIARMVRSYSFDYEEDICSRGKNKIMTNVQAMEAMIRCDLFRWELCGKIYRKCLFLKAPCEDVAALEDLDFNKDLFLLARKVFYSGENVYHYVVNLQSTTQAGNRWENNILNVYRRFLDSEWVQYNVINKIIVKNFVKEIIYQVRELFLSRPMNYAKFVNKCQNYFRELYHREPNEVNKVLSTKTINLLLLEFHSLKSFFSTYYNEYRDLLYRYSKEHKKIYIYGTGMVSRFVTILLCQSKIPYYKYIVSDGQIKSDVYMGHSVICISQLKNIDKSIGVIVAVIPKYQNEVILNLHQQGITEFLCINTEFFIS